ncbi:hypothetical protein [Aureibaculum conchae]|uniref:hypothetical protein n=1 Tax=Aureibaculum sp. 2308TA14-22 TaxID=3108392 RepID=UPI0033910282
MISAFETYISAQKTVGLHFILLGISLLLTAIIAQIIGSSALANGIKTGTLICGFMMIASGIGYRITESKLLEKQTQLFQKEEVSFQKIETERMAKVIKEYPIYQMVSIAFIIATLLFIYFIKNPYWQGISYAIIIMFVGFMIIEAFSQHSINAYFENLKN